METTTDNNAAIADVTILPQGELIFGAFFDDDYSGFTFVDDLFRGTQEPLFARGARSSEGNVISGGRIRAVIGAYDQSPVNGMSGGFVRTFSLPSAQPVVLSLRYRLLHFPDYESDEYGEALVAVNGVLLGQDGPDYLARLHGDGDGGPRRVVEWRPVGFDLGVLPAGTHTVAIGGFNNKKDSATEKTVILFDDVVVATR